MTLHYGARTAEADRKYVIAYLLIERYEGVVRKPDQALLLGLFVCYRIKSYPHVS
jgi:hypothetical protein